MYLNLDPDYFTHLKTKRLLARLGNGADILPIRLWAHCAKHHPMDGLMNGYTESEIEAILGWWGESGQCCKALVDVGFLDGVQEGFQARGWLEHQGHIKSFSERSRIANEARWGKIRNPSGTPKPPNRSPSGNPPNLTIPNLTIPNQSEPTTKRAVALVVEVPDDLKAYSGSIDEWLAYKREKGQTYKPRGLASLWAKCREMGASLPAAISESMANNYAGIYPPKKNGGHQKPVDNFEVDYSRYDKLGRHE
jgi:hypothetical protein